MTLMTNLRCSFLKQFNNDSMKTIAIITYNRLESLRTLVSQIKTHTEGEYNLIVSVDGSTDGTVEYLRENRINFINSENRGVGHAKNLAMWWFYNKTKSDVLLMLEDDCRIWEDGWNKNWEYVVNYFKFVNYFDGQQMPDTKLFNVSPPPMMVNSFGGAVMGIHRDVVAKIGYMDPRFDGYGFEHVEYAYRIYREFKDVWQGEENTIPGFNRHIGVEFNDSFFDSKKFIYNWRKAVQFVRNSHAVFSLPFDKPEDKQYFEQRIARAEVFDAADPEQCAGQVCPLCGGVGRHVGMRGEFPIRECCGILLSFPYKNKKEYERLYVDDELYHSEEQRREGQLPFFERDQQFFVAADARLKLMNSWLPFDQARAGLVDIGAGTGAFIVQAKAHDLAAIGVEPNFEMVQFAQTEKRDVHLGSWEDLAYLNLGGPCAMFVTAFDVFEHLANPIGFLKAMKAPLLPGGLLVIEMPEAACAQQVREGLEWKHIRPRQHICLYSDAAAQKMFAKTGWKVEALHRPLRGKLGKICYFLSRV